MRAATALVAEIDAEAEARGVALRSVADEVIELGLQALRAREGRLAAVPSNDAPAQATVARDYPTQEALMAI